MIVDALVDLGTILVPAEQCFQASCLKNDEKRVSNGRIWKTLKLIDAWYQNERSWEAEKDIGHYTCRQRAAFGEAWNIKITDSKNCQNGSKQWSNSELETIRDPLFKILERFVGEPKFKTIGDETKWIKILNNSWRRAPKVIQIVFLEAGRLKRRAGLRLWSLQVVDVRLARFAPWRGAAALWATASSASLRFCYYLWLWLCVSVFGFVGFSDCRFVFLCSWFVGLRVCVCMCVLRASVFLCVNAIVYSCVSRVCVLLLC